jgi:hypothetical protein
LRLEFDGKDIHRADTNLVRLGVDEALAHESIELGFMAVGAVELALEKMQVCSAIGGFRPTDFPVVEDRLGLIWKAHAPEDQEVRLTRVLQVAEFPAFADPTIFERVNLSKFLKLRTSAECVEFRNWLRTVDDLDDKELSERVNSLRSQLPLFVQGRNGIVIRLCITIALGLIPGAGLYAGPLASAVDAFIFANFFKTSGSFAFLEETLPSIFDKNNK